MDGGSKLVIGVAAVVVLAGAVVGGILFLRDEDPSTDYDARIEDDFMATCTADAEALAFARADEYCRCAYDAIRTEVPFERFLEVDAALAEDPTAVPADIDRIRTRCYLATEAAGPAPAPAPTTTAPA